MLRRLIVILLALPMLLPPGMCICQFQATFATPPAQSENSEEPVECCRCGNPNCHHQRSESTAKSATDSTGHDDVPAQKAPEHAPGCPANPCYLVHLAPKVEAKVLISDLIGDVLIATASASPLMPPSPIPLRPLEIDESPPPLFEDIFLLNCNFRC